MDPVQHVPRRVLVAFTEKVKEALEDLEKQGMITPVTSPTAWISTMVTVSKKNGRHTVHMSRPNGLKSGRTT